MNTVKKILISGSSGQLCSDICSELIKHGDKFLVVARNREEFDVTDKNKLEHYFEEVKPDYYVAGASVHNVEQIEKNPSLACEVNIIALKNAAELCNRFDCTLINFSTDYVTSGECLSEGSRTSDGLTEFSPVNPLNFYGVTKAAGEMTLKSICNKYFNIRVSSLFGK